MPVETRQLTTDAVVVLGIICSLGLIAVSALLNFRIGYRSADEPFDGWIYGAGAAMCDVMKALLPFVMAAGLRNRDALALLAGIGAFALMSTYSVTAGIGFAAEQKVFREAGRAAVISQRKSLERREAELVTAASTMAFQRTEAEVLRDIDARFAKPMGRTTLKDATDNCTNVTRAARDACAGVATLHTELETARRWSSVDAELRDTRKQLAQMGDNGTASTSDPQALMLAGLASWTNHVLTPEDVRIGLVVLVSLMFEVGSGFGLYLATTPWRQPTKTRLPSFSKRGRPQATSHATSVQQFLLGGLEEAKGQWLSEHVLLSAYQGWCLKHKVTALGQDGLRTGIMILASEVGLPFHTRNGHLELGDVGLKVDAL